MSYQAQGSEYPDTVLVVPRKGNLVSDVWMRRDVVESEESTEEGDSYTVYSYEELHHVSEGVPDADAIADGFDDYWSAFEEEDKTDSERIAELQEENEVLMLAIAELGALVGGE